MLKILSLTEEDGLFFEKAAEERFQRSLLQDIIHDLPDVIQLSGEEAVHSTIKYGVERAQFYSITHKKGISDYVYLMFTHLGSRFDEDPIYEGAHVILNASNLDGFDKADELKEFADNFIQSLFKPDKQFILKIAKYIRSRKLFNLDHYADPFKELSLDITKHFFEKYDLINQSSIDKQIAITINDLNRIGIKNTANHATIAGLVFLFGFKIYEDPSLPGLHRYFYSDSSEADKMRWLSTFVDKQFKQKISLIRTDDKLTLI